MSTEKTVGQLVAEDYRNAAVFKKYGMDFCCGGGQTIAQACETNGVNQAELEAALTEALEEPKQPDTDFNDMPLNELIDHIVQVHHTYVKEKTPILLEMVNKVKSVHGETKENVSDIAAHFNALAMELRSHMQKEEMILFPSIKNMLEPTNDGITNFAGCGIEAPINMMIYEHDSAGNELETLRALTHDYTPPKDACATHTVSYLQLKEFEEDLMQHIHLENNILFPKALALAKQGE